LKEHADKNLSGVPNLQIWMLLRSLKDKDLVELVFNWYTNTHLTSRQYYYYYLKTEGAKYLREKLGLDNIRAGKDAPVLVPQTFRPTNK
jgi:hypothetical protein